MQLTGIFALLAIALPAALAHPAILRRDDAPTDSSSTSSSGPEHPEMEHHDFHPGSISGHGKAYDHTYSSHKLDSTWAGSEGKKYEQSQAAYKSVNKCEGHTGQGEKCDTWNANEASGEAHAESQSVAGEVHESTQKDDVDWEVKAFEKEKEKKEDEKKEDEKKENEKKENEKEDEKKDGVKKEDEKKEDKKKEGERKTWTFWSRQEDGITEVVSDTEGPFTEGDDTPDADVSTDDSGDLSRRGDWGGSGMTFGGMSKSFGTSKSAGINKSGDVSKSSGINSSGDVSKASTDSTSDVSSIFQGFDTSSLLEGGLVDDGDTAAGVQRTGEFGLGGSVLKGFGLMG